MNLYQESQRLLLEGERLLQCGDVASARNRLADAADLQWRFVQALPDKRANTLSVYGLSAASLFFRAQHLDRAEEIAYWLLAKPELEQRSASELRKLLSQIWNEREMEQMGLETAGAALSVTLRSGRVLHGLAPVDAVETPLRSILSLFQRIAAWRNELPLTRTPADLVDERYYAFSSQPVAGSYRVDIQLAREEQPSFDLCGLPKSSPDDVVTSLLDVVRSAAADDYEALRQTVPDAGYRRALIRLVRSVVPDGIQVGEIELRRVGQTKEHAVTLSRGHKYVLQRMIKAMQPVAPEGESEIGSPRKEIGKLRAVDLDSNRLRLDRPPEPPFDFEKTDDILDDHIGILLNKVVVITGAYRRQRGPSRRKFVATDIEQASPDEDERPR